MVILPVDTDDEWVGYVNKCGDITGGYRSLVGGVFIDSR